MQHVKKEEGSSQTDKPAFSRTVKLIQSLFKLELAPRSIIGLGLPAYTLKDLEVYIYSYEDKMRKEFTNEKQGS